MDFIIISSIMVFAFGTWYRYYTMSPNEKITRILYMGFTPKDVTESLGMVTQWAACFLVCFGIFFTKISITIHQPLFKDLFDVITFPISALFSFYVVAGIWKWLLTPKIFIPIQDLQFGNLTWEKDFGWFSGKANLFSRSVNLHIVSKNGHPVIFDESREAFKIISQSEEKILQKASDDLLKVFNENWSDKGTINSRVFQSRLVLEAVILYPDGKAEIYYNDGNMFLGHTVIVGMSEDGIFTDADIAG